MTTNEVQVIRLKKDKLVAGGKIYRSSYDWDFTEEDLEKARVELGETEEKKERCLRLLREKLLNDKSANYRTDDSYLLRFLRVRKYDVDRTYKNIKIFYEERRKRPELFILPENLRSLLDTKYLVCLPYTDEEGRIIFLTTIGNWNTQERSVEEITQTAFSMIDVCIMNPKCQVNGAIFLMDFREMRMSHISEMLKKNYLTSMIKFWQNGFPYRISKGIIMNSSRVVKFLYNISRPFMSKKIQNRIIFLGSDPTELHQFIDPAILPKSLGGAVDDEDCKVTNYVMENLNYLKYERSFH